jgi:hypothetical protein
MRITVTAFLIVLSACATTSKTVPAGPDTYTISAANRLCAGCTPAVIRANDRATALCAKQQKDMVRRDEKNEMLDVGVGQRYTLTFGCVHRG